jgi:hypothetical protein
LDRKADLPDDGAQSAGLEIAPGMDRDRHSTHGVIGMDEHMMASHSPIEDEACSD